MGQNNDSKRYCAPIHAFLAAALLVRSVALAVALLAILPVATAGADVIDQSGQREAGATEVEAEKREEKNGTAIPGLKFIFGITVESELARNRDLDKDVKDNLAVLEPEFNVQIEYEPVQWFDATLKLALKRDFALEQQGESRARRETSLNVALANIRFKKIFDSFALQLGRQEFVENRGWLYDEDMDGARVYFEREKLLAEFSISRKTLVDADILKRDRPDRINNYIFFLNYEATDDLRLNAYTIFRDDRAKQEGSPIFIGLRSLGTLVGRLDHWVEVAHVRGRDGAQKLRGFAFDVAGTYRLDLPLNPYVSLGYAFGSGDSNPGDNRDKAFRQTGLQTNEYQFAGAAPFLIYGEAFDPELSNLRILTAGLGFRPIETFSIDFVYHYYRQHVIANELRNAAVTLDPNQDPSRQSRDLGSEFDVVLGFRDLFGIKTLAVDLRLGYFFPGRAFRAVVDEANQIFKDPDRSFVLHGKIEYEY